MLKIVNTNMVEEVIDLFFKRESLHYFKCDACNMGEVSATKLLSFQRAPNALCSQQKRFIQKHITFTSYLDLSKYSSRKLEYRLSTVIVHSDHDIDRGHYIAIDSSGIGRYYEFNDQRVREITIEEVLATREYTLFYERIGPIDESELSSEYEDEPPAAARHIREVPADSTGSARHCRCTTDIK